MITVDSNVLVYVHDGHDTEKQATAITVVRALMQKEAKIALQCVGEFYSVLVRKLRTPSWEAAQEARNLLMSFETFRSSQTASLSALSAAAAGRSSYWDALLIHTASETGHTALITEDRQHAAVVAGVEIVNPFNPLGGLSDRAREILEL